MYKLKVESEDGRIIFDEKVLSFSLSQWTIRYFVQSKEGFIKIDPTDIVYRD